MKYAVKLPSALIVVESAITPAKLDYAVKPEVGIPVPPNFMFGYAN